MGGPTITLPGETFASRHSASYMSNAGLPDWLTTSVEAYIEMAVARAADLRCLGCIARKPAAKDASKPALRCASVRPGSWRRTAPGMARHGAKR